MTITWPGTSFNGRTCTVKTGSPLVSVSGNLVSDIGTSDPGVLGWGFLGPDENIYGVASVFTYNAAIDRTTFTLSRNYLGSTIGSATVTLSIATPMVVDWIAHTLAIADPIKLLTTGSLPTGPVVGTTYYVSASGFGVDSFSVSDTQAHALAGTNLINSTGTQSGVHTAQTVPASGRFDLLPFNGLSAMAAYQLSRLLALQTATGTVIDVSEHGAPGDGSDQTAAIALAFSLAADASVAIPDNPDDSGNSGYIDSAVTPALYFPAGKYRISASVGAGINHVRIIGDRAEIYTTDRTIDLFNLGTRNVLVQGFIFDGGKRHLRFGGDRREAGFMTVYQNEFRNSKARCIHLDRADIPTQPGYPARMQIDACKSYGSGFLEAYCNGIQISNSWLAWDVSATSWDGGPLIKANDNVQWSNVTEVPFNVVDGSNPSQYPRFEDGGDGSAWGGSFLADQLRVFAYGSRFGGEATNTPFFEFYNPGSEFVTDNCAHFGVAACYWGKCHAVPNLIDIMRPSVDSFVNTWGLWFDSATITDAAAVTSLTRFNLDLRTASAGAYQRIWSLDSTVQGGAVLPFLADQLPTVGAASDLILDNLIPGDGITFWASPYVITNRGNYSGFDSTQAMLGYSLGYGTSSADTWYQEVGVSGFTAPGPGIYTWSAWVHLANSSGVALFRPDVAASVYTHSQTLQAGLNFVTARFFHDGVTATQPSMLVQGSDSGVILTMGLFAIHQGPVAARWRPPLSNNSADMLPMMDWGSAPPTTGVWPRGWIRWNSAPSSGGPPGWVCTTGGGSGGTFKAMANLA